MILPVPVEGWLYDAIIAAGHCPVERCAVSGVVYEHQVRLTHNGIETVFRLPNIADDTVWDRFIGAWSATTAELHTSGVAVIDLTESVA